MQFFKDDQLCPVQGEQLSIPAIKPSFFLFFYVLLAFCLRDFGTELCLCLSDDCR